MESNCDIPEDVLLAAEQASSLLLPAKSRDRYDKAYAGFVEWREKKNVKKVNEQVILAYVQELSEAFAPSSLWSIISMVKTSLLVKEKIDISQYGQVRALLKRKSEGYKPKKSKVLSAEHIKQFILQAPDEVHLLTKVILIFGIYGLCRREELTLLSIDDIDDTGKHVIVLLKDTKNKTSRRFAITDDGCDFQPYGLYRKYVALRPSNLKTKRFFLCYRNGKCTSQHVGIHSVGAVPCKIATYLGLETPHLYTGHAFRRSSATLMADNGASTLTIKRQGGWKSAAVAESYIDDSVGQKLAVAKQIFQGFVAEPSTQSFQETGVSAISCEASSLTSLSSTSSGGIRISNNTNCPITLNINCTHCNPVKQ